VLPISLKTRHLCIILLTLTLAAGLLTLTRPSEAQQTLQADLRLKEGSSNLLEVGKREQLDSSTNKPTDPVSVGQELTYIISFMNHGPDTASNVVFKDVLPADARFIDSSFNCTQSGNVVECPIGDVPSEHGYSFGITVCPTVPGNITDTATVESDTTDPTPVNNTDTETTTIVSDPPPPGKPTCPVTPPQKKPETKADCKSGGYKEFGFKNQGQCIKYVNHANK
jgi:uncharacterized repeat protein (TIGR01451 family)